MAADLAAAPGFKSRRGAWAYGPDAHTAVDAAHALAWNEPDNLGDRHPVSQAFRDGHTETWYAAGAYAGLVGPDGTRRLVVTTADPASPAQQHRPGLPRGHQPRQAKRRQG